MGVYLIDSENVAKEYLCDLKYLTRKDKLIIFVSDSSTNLKYKDVDEIIKCKARVKIINCLFERNEHKKRRNGQTIGVLHGNDGRKE